MSLPPTLGSEVRLTAVALLDSLEKATGWSYCRFWYHVGSRCTCMGAFPPSWSQVVGESPGCGVTASSGGLTTPGMPATGYLPPPPGLPAIDYSKWRLPLPEASATGVATAPLCLAGVGRGAGLWGTVKRITGSPHPGGLAQRHPRQCRVRPRRCLSDSHAWSSPPRHTNKRCNRQKDLRGGEPLLTPPQIKPPQPVAQRRTVEGLQREGGDPAAAPLVTQEVHQGWRVRSGSIRRVVCPPG